MISLRNILATILLITPMAVLANASPMVNPNRADAQEMHDDLIGVTESQAASIVQYRKDRGYFNSKEELLKVQGIGRDFLNINQDYMYLGDESGRKVSG